MPPKLAGFYYDEEKKRYFAVPRGGMQISTPTEFTQRLQRKIVEDAEESTAEKLAAITDSSFTRQMEENRKATNQRLDDCQHLSEIDPKVLKLSTLMSEKLRQLAQFPKARLQTGCSEPLLDLHGLKFQYIGMYPMEGKFDGILVLPGDQTSGRIFQLQLGKHPECRAGHFSVNSDGTLVVEHMDDSQKMDTESLFLLGLNTSNAFAHKRVLKEWCKRERITQLKNGFNAGSITIRSDITFMHNSPPFKCTGFRDGTVQIKYTSFQHQSLLRTEAAVCCVRFLSSNGYTICIVSGINNSLKSYKLNDVAMEWSPFLSYTGYNNRAKLSENLKVTHNSVKTILDRVFVVESYDGLLKRNVLLFYDFAMQNPLRCQEIPIAFNEVSHAQWSISNSNLLIANTGQRVVEIHQISTV